MRLRLLFRRLLKIYAVISSIATLYACSTHPYVGTHLELVNSFPLSIPVALLPPIAIDRPPSICDGSITLISLPDEVVCESQSSWVFLPSKRLLPAHDLLLIGLLYAGISITPYQSFLDAKQAGQKIGILVIVASPKAWMMRPRDFYLSRTTFFQRVKDGHILTGQPDDNETRVVASVSLEVIVVDLVSADILWAGPIQQSMEDVLPIPPLGEGRGRIESGAGIGEFEAQLHGIRSLVVQAYLQATSGIAARVQKIGSPNK